LFEILAKTPRITKSQSPPLPLFGFSHTLSFMPVMDNAAGAQPQHQTTVPAGGEQPQRQELDVQSAIDGMTNEQEIGNLLFGNGEPAAPPPQAEPEPSGADPGDPNTPAESDPEPQDPPAGEQPQEPAAEDAPPEPQAPTQSLERISLKSLHPDARGHIAQAKELVRNGEAASFADAFTSLVKPEPGTQEPSPAAQAPAPTQDPQPAATPAVEPDQSVTALTSRLADLRAQRKAAVEEFDRPAEIELTNQIEDALAELAEAKSQAALQQRESAIQNQAIEAVIQDIYVEHPDAEDATSYFSYRMTQEVDAYETAHGPIRNHPTQLKALAAKVAREIGTAPGKQPQAQAPAQPQPRQQARPIGTAAPGNAGAVRTSPDQIQQLINSADADTLRDALFGPA
jgi:hypothetical protein